MELVVAMLVVVLALPVLIAFSAMWEGYALSVLWGWFVVPAFGLPALSLPLAIGLALIVGLLTSHKSGNEATDDDRKWAPLLVLVLRPAFALGIGWVVMKFL